MDQGCGRRVRAAEDSFYSMLSASAITELHDSETRAAHRIALASLPLPRDPWLAMVASQHRANFELWHIEDLARDPQATDTDLAQVKRRIDRTNQLRNDLAEQLDRFLLDELAPRSLPHQAAALHSESPGLMIDRLSILSLKLFHTREEAERTNAPAGHAERNQARLTVLAEQRSDLAQCLDALWAETLAGKRRFKIYRQLKMYNDPSLNPVLYKQAGGEPAS
jgi:hypothetical protein